MFLVKKRLGIFAFYDREGVVDRYVEYLLHDILNCLEKLVIVCNGALTHEGYSILQKYTDNIFIRDNTGYDAMAYKMALTQYWGWEKVAGFDELLLFNDTFYGPFISFQTIFDQMEENPADFWGLTKYYGGAENCGKRPEHIQLNFLVIRKKMLNDNVFISYWSQFDSSKWSFGEVVEKHEWLFTRKMNMAGFSYTSAVSAPEFEELNPKENIVQYFSVSYELLKYHDCPFLKRKPFAGINCNYTVGLDLRNSLDWIAEETDYDTTMIWDNILRLYNIYNIYESLHLDYLVTDKAPYEKEFSNNNLSACIVIWEKNREFEKETNGYLSQVPNSIKVYRWNGKEKQSDLEFLLFLKETVRNYDYCCVITDEIFQNSTSNYRRKLHRERIFENTIKNKNYIVNVIQIMQQNERLGYLAVPNAIHNEFFGTFGGHWGDGYKATVHNLVDIGLKPNLSENIDCLTIGEGFWCKSKALEPLWVLPKQKIKELNVRGLGRMFPYIAQSKGYYSGMVMNLDYASYTINTIQRTMSEILKHELVQSKITDLQSLLINRLIEYCKKKKCIYIFGAGGTAEIVACILKNNGVKFIGYLISDHFIKRDDLDNKIYHISEVTIDTDEDGIIIAINQRNRKGVLGEIQDKGFDYYIF